MKQTTSARGRAQPGEAGGAEARAPARRPRARRARRAIAAEPSRRAVVDDDRAVAGGHPRRAPTGGHAPRRGREGSTSVTARRRLGTARRAIPLRLAERAPVPARRACARRLTSCSCSSPEAPGSSARTSSTRCSPPATTSACSTVAPTASGDVRDAAMSVRRARSHGVDAVCHQAAMVGLGVDFGDIADYVVAQRPRHRRAAARARRAGASAGRLVLASSMVVYGEGRYRCAEHGVGPPGAAPRRRPRRRPLRAAAARAAARRSTPRPIAEDAPADPRNVYAATKLHQEHLCRRVRARDRRAGHRAALPQRLRAADAARHARTPASRRSSAARWPPGARPRVFEDGGQLRDFVHVRDVARANLAGAAAPEPAPGAFNVCSGTPRSVGEMAHALRAAHGDAAPPVEVTGEYRLGDVRHVFASRGARRRRAGLHRAGGLRHRDGRTRR